MKAKKLKKSLSAVFLSQIYFKSPVFVIEEKTKSKTLTSYTFLKFLTKFFFSFEKIALKYPLSIKFLGGVGSLQNVLSKDSKIVFVNLREFFLKTEYLTIKNSLFFANSFSHVEFLLKKDVTLFNYMFKGVV